MKFLIDSGYMIFDTEYMFIGEPTTETEVLFEISETEIALSTNAKAWFGYKRKSWGDFKQEFYELKRTIGLVQTNLVCINKKQLSEFVSILPYLNTSAREE